MATPISWAQDIITCDLCDNPTQQFCNNCQVSLCEECINKHVKKHKSLTHDIVPFTNRKIQIVFPECEFHPNQRCEAHCQQCDVPVCMKCIITSHNGHSVRDIPDIFNVKKREIQKESHELEFSIIPKYKKKYEDTEKDTTMYIERYTELEKEAENHRKRWHQEVDTIFNKLSALIKSTKDDHLKILKLYQAKLKNLIPEIIETVQQNKEMLKFSKVSKVTNYKSKLTEYKNIPVDVEVSIPSLKANTIQERELKIELGEYMATLTQTPFSILTDEDSYLSARELLDKAKLIATIPTGVHRINAVACVGADKAWVSGEDLTIKCVDIYGSVQDTVTTTCLLGPDDISVTRQGELLFSNYDDRTVNIVRHGRTEVILTIPKEWTPGGLCCTRLGDILVNLSKGPLKKIVRYQGQRVKQEIFIDENGKRIFESGLQMLYVAENSNGDICVTDTNAKTVVVMDKTGKVRFQYNGTQAKRKSVFYPKNIVTDSMSQIIVADHSNDCFHILDQDGHFRKCVDNCGLSRPSGLSADSEGRIWVGLLENGEVKVIQYTK